MKEEEFNLEVLDDCIFFCFLFVFDLTEVCKENTILHS